MNRDIIKTYQLFLNTRSADQGTSSNCTFVINPPITVSHSNNRFMMGVKMCELPYSFNQLNSEWVNLSIGYTGQADRTITLVQGNYNALQLATELITQIVASGLGLLSTNFNITYDSTRGKFSFQMVGTGANVMTLRFGSNVVLGTMFGCPANIGFTTTAVISANKINVNPVSSVFIRSNSIKTGAAFEAINAPYKTSNILAKIPVPLLPNSIIYFRNDFSTELITNQSIDTLNLYLTDNLSNNTLDLGGVNYGLMIILEEIISPDMLQQDTDKLTAVNPTESLISQRDTLLNELMAKKLKLTSEMKNNMTT
jgi:hypothetical protein